MKATHPGGGASENAAEPRATGAGRAARLAAAGGVLGALAASACCIAPLALFALGASGAWIGNLTALAPYQPYVIAATLVFLGAGFVLAYRKVPGLSCARPAVGRLTKPALWAAAALVAAAAAFPYVAPALLDL